MQLAFAETFMREQLTDEAENIFRDIFGGGKYTQLRKATDLARIAQFNSRWEEARTHWTEALRLMSAHFPRGATHSGYTSLAILQSMYAVLQNSGELAVASRTLQQVGSIRETCAADGCKHWIAGLSSYWLEHVRSFTPPNDDAR